MRILFIIIFLIPTVVFADNSDELGKATEYTKKAILSYPTVKKYKKRIENKLYKTINIDKKTIAWLTTAISIAQNQQIDTRQIKNMKLEMLGLKIRPNIIYNIKTNKIQGMASISMSF